MKQQSSCVLTHIGEGEDVMPMPYRESGLIEAVAKYHTAEEAEVSPAGSPVDFLKITREIARSPIRDRRRRDRDC